MQRDFTASAYILNENLVLLLWHPKLQKWLPPGGHLEKDETPDEAVRREVLEETGLNIELITQENLFIQESNARSIPRPYLCLLENIPAYKDTPFHQHIDFIFVAKALNPEALISHEGMTLKWFSEKEIELLLEEEEIFKETKNTIQHILETFSMEFQ